MKKLVTLAAVVACAAVPSAAQASVAGAVKAVKREVEDNNGWQRALDVRCTRLTRTKYTCKFNLQDNETATLRANRRATVRQYGSRYVVSGNWD